MPLPTKPIIKSETRLFWHRKKKRRSNQIYRHCRYWGCCWFAKERNSEGGLSFRVEPRECASSAPLAAEEKQYMYDFILFF